MEDDFKRAVQHQRRVNPNIHEVIKKEVVKLLDAGLIYPISDSPWVSPVHCVPKKGGMTVVTNEDNELILTRCMMAIFPRHRSEETWKPSGMISRSSMDSFYLPLLFKQNAQKVRRHQSFSKIGRSATSWVNEGIGLLPTFSEFATAICYIEDSFLSQTKRYAAQNLSDLAVCLSTAFSLLRFASLDCDLSTALFTAICLSSSLRFVVALHYDLSTSSCLLLHDIQAAGSNTHPLMLDRTDYESWAQRFRLYFKIEGEVMFEPERPRTYADLDYHEQERYKDDFHTTIFLLEGLPKDIYMLVNYITEAKVIWNYIKMLMGEQEHVAIYEQRVKFELTDREQKIDDQMRMLIQERNFREEKLKKELHSLQLQLNHTIHHKKIMQDSVNTLQQDFKQKEMKLLNDFSRLKTLKNKLENKLYAQDQSIQTVHMMLKPKTVGDEHSEKDIVDPNPFHLKKAKMVQPTIYDGDEILKPHHIPVHLFIDVMKKPLEIAETSNKKCLEKMKNLGKAKNLKPTTSTLRKLAAAMVYPPNTPGHLVPRTLPTKCISVISIFVLNQLFADFDKMCTKRITPTGITEEERGFEQTKRCYLTEVIPFFKLLKEHFEGVQKTLVTEVKEMKEIFESIEAEVDQNAIDLMSGEIERKNLLITNENLIVKCIAQDVFYTITDSALTASQFHELSIAYNVAKTPNKSGVTGTLLPQPLESQNFQLQDTINKLQKENNCFRAKIKIKRHYKELYDSIKITRAKHLEQTTALLTENESLKVQIHNKLSCVNKDHVKPKVLAPGKYAIDVEPIPPRNRNNREVHLVYLKHLKESVETLREIVEEAKVERPLDSSLASACRYTKHSQELLEYVIGTCPKDLNTRDNKHASTPLPKKKQVTFEEQCAMSKSNTHKPVEQLNCQKTNVPVPPSTGVNSCTDASRSQPRSNTKKNRILPAKSVNMKKVEEHPRTIKSSLKTTNRVDSSISSKHTIINSNSHSVCQTCNKCLISANHDMCVVTYLHSVNASPSVKNVVRKVKQVWKPKQVKQVWKPTGNILTIVGYQWMPTGRTFTLGEQCPLTRLTKPNKVSAIAYANLREPNLKGGGEKKFGILLRKLPSLSVFQMQVDISSLAFGLRLFKNVKPGIARAQEFHEKVQVKFLRSKDETPEVVIKFLKQIQVGLNKTVRIIRIDNGTEFVNKDLTGYYERVGIFHQKRILRTPQQNGVVERRNRTLVEATRTMLIFSKARCFYGQKLYFGALCYPINDSEDLGKLQPTADVGIFVGYAPSSPTPTFLTPGQISLRLVPNLVPSAPYVPPTNKELEILFQPMFDEYMEPPRVERPVSPAPQSKFQSIHLLHLIYNHMLRDAPSLSHSPHLRHTISKLHQGVGKLNLYSHEAIFAHLSNKSLHKRICSGT
ncbi:retrovirus-related pol polyprotein from transposon TNT 1-94 [Tanacetum coccineum]